MHWTQGVNGWISFAWWVVLILIAVLITSYFVKRNKHPNESKALEILKERFAKGRNSQRGA
jgi:uncharacterized membrane protein